jgi:FixJ family two-component response regulator
VNPHEAAGELVIVVDDDAAVRKALSRLLRANGFAVESFDCAEAFLARTTRPEPACLVLDVSLPDLDGLTLQRQLGETGESHPIIFLTGHGDIPMSVSAMKAGAVDFLTKPVEGQQLIGSVRAAVEKGASSSAARAEEAELRERFESLSPREREVLAGLAAGKLNKQVAADLGIVEQTVKFHRARIMERMRAKSAAELMLLAAKLSLL